MGVIKKFSLILLGVVNCSVEMSLEKTFLSKRKTKEFADFDDFFQAKFVKTVTSGEGEVSYLMNRSLKSPARADHLYDSLHEAAAANDVVGIQQLLKSPIFVKTLNSFDEYGCTPLQIAVVCVCEGAISYLIEAGADPYMLNQQEEYSAWSLAQAYAKSIAYMNVVPLLVLQQALIEKQIPLPKKVVKDTRPPFKQEAKPRKVIRLVRRSARSDLTTQEDPSDEYVLNV